MKLSHTIKTLIKSFVEKHIVSETPQELEKVEFSNSYRKYYNKVSVRFPNNSEPMIVNRFYSEEFKVEKEFDNEVFGIWKDTHIFIDRKSYEKFKNNK